MAVSNEIQTLASGMIANQMRQDVIANNMANVSTAGYKKNYAVDYSFADALETATNRSYRDRLPLNDEIVHTFVPGADTLALTHETTTSYSQGDMHLTGNKLDLALAGDGYFAVQAEDGVRYTRNGSFMLNANNELINQRGERVLGEGGEDGSGVPIVVNGRDVAILPDGTVQSDGINAGKLQIVQFENMDSLEKVGKSFFKYRGNESEITAVDVPAVEQGYLERSNVNSLTEMTHMISNTRHYEIAGKALKSIEQSISRSIVELPKFK